MIARILTGKVMGAPTRLDQYSSPRPALIPPIRFRKLKAVNVIETTVSPKGAAEISAPWTAPRQPQKHCQSGPTSGQPVQSVAETHPETADFKSLTIEGGFRRPRSEYEIPHPPRGGSPE